MVNKHIMHMRLKLPPPSNRKDILRAEIQIVLSMSVVDATMATNNATALFASIFTCTTKDPTASHHRDSLSSMRKKPPVEPYVPSSQD
jgi:hypothetical protein